jgi:hypothetical protein
MTPLPEPSIVAPSAVSGGSGLEPTEMTAGAAAGKTAGSKRMVDAPPLLTAAIAARRVQLLGCGQVPAASAVDVTVTMPAARAAGGHPPPPARTAATATSRRRPVRALIARHATDSAAAPATRR